MEIPIQVAVKVFATEHAEDDFIQIISSPKINEYPSTIPATGLIKVEGRTFPATHVLAKDATQTMVFFQTVYPLIGSFMEGFDVSVLTYGQTGSGKTYTLFGPGFDCIYGEAEQGVVQRCIREIFTHMSNQTDKQFILNVEWIELNGDQALDLLDGMVQLTSVGEAFQYLQIGMGNKSSGKNHSSLSLTLEQNWVSPEGLIQHRLSTFSFCDLSGTDRHYLANSQNYFQPKDPGLHHLERIVASLTDVTQIYSNQIEYNQTPLTAMLKDSFGGRAQTLMFLCISPLQEHITETVVNLQFAYQVQLVRNFVVMNTFSDNNTPIHLDTVPEHDVDTLGLQFAATQWLKLVSNAEGLFRNLISRKTLSDQDREQIEEWMFLKAECEECLSSGEVNLGKLRPLVPIQEADEMDEETDHENTNRRNSDNESDSESQRPDLMEKIENLMEEFRLKTDNLVEQKHEEFKKSHPRAVYDSNDSFRGENSSTFRRKSIQPGSSLSSADIAMLQKVADRDNGNLSSFRDDILDSSTDLTPVRKQTETVTKKIMKIETDIEASQRQIKELDHTISLKQKLFADLIRNNDTRTTAKQRFNKKKNKLESEYEKTKKALSKAVISGDKMESDRLKQMTSHIEHRLQDLASIKHIAGENGQKLKKLQKSLQESQKQLEVLQKSIKKQMKTKESLENALKEEKSKEKGLSTLGRGKKNLKEVAARISHLDHVLKEKSQSLEQYSTVGEKESLRHEIRNLRRTRDHLIEQRCHLDKKRKRERITQTEERKLLECDEAIEIIDATIEFKNELMLGHKSIDTNEKLQREKGEQMLMARLNKLSTDEMRTLIYKYFLKVIDLRESSRTLESNLDELERERDAWEWRERVLSNAVRQARLEGERHAVLLQRQHETKLTLMLRHLAEETSTSSSMATDRFIPPSTSTIPDSDFDVDLYKPGSSKHYHQHHHRQPKSAELDLCPTNDDHLYHYRPLDKYKEKDRDIKNRLFHKIQVLTRYHGGSGGADKRKIAESTIPHENLKQLQSSTVPMTKVTREKNKLIIQQNPSR